MGSEQSSLSQGSIDRYGQNKGSLGFSNGIDSKRDIFGSSKAFNPLDGPQGRDLSDTAPRAQARFDAPLGPMKVSSTLGVPSNDLTRVRHTIGVGSDNTKLKYAETIREERTFGVEHRIDHRNAPMKHTFVESGVVTKSTSNGSGLYAKLGWSF